MLSDKLEKLVDDMIEKGVRFDDAVREFEKRFIARVLGQCDGSVTKAADALGVHRNTLSRKIVDYKIRKRTA
jgi:DNA-binding NtrC family response regulator